jgi:hypothetical protein
MGCRIWQFLTIGEWFCSSDIIIPLQHCYHGLGNNNQVEYTNQASCQLKNHTTIITIVMWDNIIITRVAIIATLVKKAKMPTTATCNGA